jgi:hypothetical protein
MALTYLMSPMNGIIGVFKGELLFVALICHNCAYQELDKCAVI